MFLYCWFWIFFCTDHHHSYLLRFQHIHQEHLPNPSFLPLREPKHFSRGFFGQGYPASYQQITCQFQIFTCNPVFPENWKYHEWKDRSGPLMHAIHNNSLMPWNPFTVRQSSCVLVRLQNCGVTQPQGWISWIYSTSSSAFLWGREPSPMQEVLVPGKCFLHHREVSPLLAEWIPTLMSWLLTLSLPQGCSGKGEEGFNPSISIWFYHSILRLIFYC